MNLALHGFLLQVFVSILDFQHGSLLCSAGEPGYLDFDNLPETNFSCQGKVIGGYYADVEAGCQMFHVCTIGQKDEIMDIKFLCLNGTVFDQETRVCERVDEVDCSKSERFYNLNLELYGNNAVTLSLHENSEDEDDVLESLDDHQQRTTSARPTTTSSTTTTTSKPSKPSTTPSSSSFSHPTGYPQHYQPQPPFPQVHTSQSKSLYDDKNGGYHHQYIFHNGERNNNQATSYQLFSNQGVSSTTVQTPQVHQIRFSSSSSPQIIHNEPSTVAPLFHATSATIQTLLNSNANSPALINPIFHNHGIASTTEQFSIHSNNPRDTSDYRDNGEPNLRPLEAVQSTSKGKVSKLTISPVPTQSEPSRSVQTKTSQSSQQQRISGNFLPTPSTIETTVRSFYPTPRTSIKSSSSQSSNDQVTQHIHLLPPVPIPQLKPQQITINLSPPDIQRIVQNPSPLLPSQSRVIVTAKASVSDESGRPLNTTQLVTLPLPTIPASYDDYKEGDESFDPFYRDVPKIRNNRRDLKRLNSGLKLVRMRRSLDEKTQSIGSFIYDLNPESEEDLRVLDINEKPVNKDKTLSDELQSFKLIKESLLKFRDILFSKEITEDSIRGIFENEADKTLKSNAGEKLRNRYENRRHVPDLQTKASKNLKAPEYEDEAYDDADTKVDKEAVAKQLDSSVDTKISEGEEYVDVKEQGKNRSEKNLENKEFDSEKGESVSLVPSDQNRSPEVSSDVVKDANQPETKINVSTPVQDQRVLDVVILDTDQYLKLKSSGQEKTENSTEEKYINTSTDVPVVSTSEQSIESKAQEKLVDTKNTKDTERLAIKDEPSYSRTIGAGEISDRIKQKEESQESKSNPRRKSSRIRLPKGRISARRKQQNHSRKVPHESTTEAREAPTTESPIELLEAKQINSRIFDEPESQTAKALDTRAVGQRENYVKSLQGGKAQDSTDSGKKGEVNDYEILEKNRNTLEKHQYKLSEAAVEDKKFDSHKNTFSSSNGKEEENSKKSNVKQESSKEADRAVEVTTQVSTEESKVKEESSTKGRETVEDESTTVSSDEVLENTSETTTEKKLSRGVNKTSRGKSMKFEDSSSKEVYSHRQDKSWKPEDADEELESQEYSMITSTEEIHSEEASSEYQESTEASFENTREISGEEEYTESGSLEDTTTSVEQNTSEEISDSREGSVEESTEEADESTSSDREDSTEGVLKFTDELPKDKSEDTTETEKSSESDENIAQDYVDDNYEPHNYKENESTNSNNVSNEKKNKNEERKDKNQNSDEESTENLTTESFEEKEEKTEEWSEETIETTTATTTSVRPTPPKLFKPISARKSYNYIPPTTPPNPVIIKPRLALLNPKPARPFKSYNDLAPKPVIRKFPLLVRKTTTTTAGTTTIDAKDDFESTETPVTTTEVGRSEENGLEGKPGTKEQEESSTIALMEKETFFKSKDDQIPSPSEQTSPPIPRKEDEDPNKNTENFTPYPMTRLSTLGSTLEETLEAIESTSVEPEKSTSLKTVEPVDEGSISTTILPVTIAPMKLNASETSANKSVIEEETIISSSAKAEHYDTTETFLVSEAPTSSTTQSTTQSDLDTTEKIQSTSVRSIVRKTVNLRRPISFNCLEKEMYRFYGDRRDCRLFHYCSPGFTSRQVLDIRFVCEEGTAFDEESQSCRHDVRNRKCPNKSW